MKVTTDTAERMVLEHKPRALAVLLVVLALGLAGLGVGVWVQGDAEQGQILLAASLAPVVGMAAFLSWVRVVLDRDAGAVHMDQRSFRGRTSTTLPLTQVVAAEVEDHDSFDDDGDDTTYRPVLRLCDGTVQPLVAVFSSSRWPDLVVEAINRWLAGARMTR